MSDLFGNTDPLRIVLHVNVEPGGMRFDWDGMTTNPATGDLLAMQATIGRARHDLGPELARMLLWLHKQVWQNEDGPAGEPTDPPELGDRVPVDPRRPRA